MGERAEADENISASITRASSLWDGFPGPSSHLKICLADNLSVTLQGELLPRLLWPSRPLGPRQMGSTVSSDGEKKQRLRGESQTEPHVGIRGIACLLHFFVTLLLATLNFHPESPKLLLKPC